MALTLAYLDPGAGSIVLQMILAGILGLGYTLKLYSRKLLRLVRRERDQDATGDAAKDSRDEIP